MRKKTLISLSFLCIVMLTNAQETMPLSKWNMKLSYYFYESEMWHYENDHSITLDLDYRLNRYFEVGGWLGWGFYHEGVPIDNHENSYRIYTKSMLLYGVNGVFNILPIITKDRETRLKIYLSGKLGANYKMSSEGSTPARGNYFQYAAYAGASYYLGRHFGVFVEGGLSNMIPIKYGFAVKF